MIDSTRSGHVGHERAARSPELVVEPDARCERQDPRADARAQALGGASAVALQREEVLEGLKDRLDPLADASQARAAARGLVRAGRAHHLPAELGHGGLEGGADIALVADDDLAPAQRPGKELQRDLALFLVGAPELGPARRPV